MEWGWTKGDMDRGTEGDEEGSQSSGYPGHVDYEVPQGLVGQYPGSCLMSILGSPVWALGWTPETFILSHPSTGCV